MSKVHDMKSMAEVPSWVEPLAEAIASRIRQDLQANTTELLMIQTQLGDLLEAQVIFLESIHTRSVK